jgi:alpha-glucosidase
VDISGGSSSDGDWTASILPLERLYSADAMWWRDAVVYQIYPRSFQDSDGDGVGDLRGITGRLDHLAWLRVDALWLSPIYPSPLADFGYDVSDYTAVDPQLGSLEDFDELVEAAHGRGLRVLLDLILCHTSIDHPWFREHPDWYIWSPVDGAPNNWVSVFGGSAWSRDEQSGRWYLHSFYPEQPDLNWRNPEVVDAMQGVVRFWRGRGVDGFRLDAIDRLVKDDQLRDNPPATKPFPLPLREDEAKLEPLYSGNRPEAIDALRAVREAAGDALLVGEVFRPVSEYERYLEVLDLVFAFEFLFSPWEAERLRAAIEPAAQLGRVAWVMSNHDFDRLATRVGPKNVRAAAVLLLTLPGVSFVYQGDEIGLANGPGADPPYDRAGRDGMRHPMQWDASPTGGFTSGEPWLVPVDPQERSVEAQREDPALLLGLYRRLIELRGELGEGFRLLDAEPGVVSYERGEHTVAVNTTAEQRSAPRGEVLLSTHPGPELPPHAGLIVRN